MSLSQLQTLQALLIDQTTPSVKIKNYASVNMSYCNKETSNFKEDEKIMRRMGAHNIRRLNSIKPDGKLT